MSRTALFNAAKAWDAEKVTALLGKDPDLIKARDARGRSALHVCALSRWDGKSPSAHASIATARALLAAGEDINVVHEIPDDGEIFPATPLWCALAWGRNLPLTKMLLEGGANPDWCLWTVVWSDEVIPLRMLLAARARTDLTFDGETPLLYAARLGREGPLRELVRAGARIDVKDRKGRSPLDQCPPQALEPQHPGDAGWRPRAPKTAGGETRTAARLTAPQGWGLNHRAASGGGGARTTIRRLGDKMGKRIGIVVGVIVLIGLLVLGWAVIRPGPLDFADGKAVALAEYNGRPTGVPADFPGDDPLARGKYLAVAADCEACHTAEAGKPFAGGRPFDTEFGTLYSPNITPDPETGIGSWSDAEFLRAMHEGIGKDGEHLYPAFPYAAYTYLTDEDVLAIKAYIFSLPPEKNTAPEHTLRWPYNQRGLMRFWSAFYNPKERFQPVAEQTPTWNRGAYLAEALGHCGDCHTPRTALQSLDNRNKFSGGMAEGWRAYNLTSDKESGIGNWSQEELEQYLKTGHTMNRGSAFGPMAQAVHLSFQNLTASDVSAIVEYVRSIPPVSTPDLPAPKLEPAPEYPSGHQVAEANPRGHEIFAGTCSGCHSWTGVSDYVPHATLTGSRSVNDPTATNVALAVLRGATDLPPAGNAVVTMPAFGHVYSDDDVAAVSNYVIARFGAAPSSITAAEVGKLRAAR